jgi:patatin-like phospholipase/acyl hydrolase
MKKILSLCGGGTSGYLSACLLAYVEELIDGKIHEEFDMIVGVSTGSIIGSLLSTGHNSDEIKVIYRAFYKKVFGEKKAFWRTLFGPLYDNQMLKESMYELIGDARLDELPTKFMTYAVELNRPELKPQFWKSWKNDDYLSDVVSASSCAPILFKPIEIEGKHYCEGGVILNDPSLFAYAEAKRLWGDEEIKILDIQTDHNLGFENPSKLRSLYSYGKEILSISTDCGERSVSYTCKTLLGSNYLNLLPHIYLDIDSDDWNAMETASGLLIIEQKDKLKNFFIDP